MPRVARVNRAASAASAAATASVDGSPRRRRPTAAASVDFYTHDNGARPWGIKRLRSTVRVTQGRLSLSLPCRKLYIGTSSGLADTCDHKASDAAKFYGNTVVMSGVREDDAKIFAYVQRRVSTFRLLEDDDTAESEAQLVSPVGRNDVPYPVFVTRKYAYFLLDMVAVPVSCLDASAPLETAYVQYYRHGKSWEKFAVEHRLVAA
jgi:hypothetical protein